MAETQIQKRKFEHLRIFRNENVNFEKSAGFENYSLLHDSLPEQHIEEIDVTQFFLGYELSFPFMINAITGGEKSGGKLNRELATIASKQKIAMGLGSLRPCFEKDADIDSFSIVKEVAQNVPVIGNIGGQQLLQFGIDQIEAVLAAVGADALAVHLNPLQEALQPEGDKNFVGIRDKIGILARNLTKPVIVKEVGFGLPLKNIEELAKMGLQWFDISGAGGTSWARIEKKRNSSPIDIAVANEFVEFGIPTSELLEKAMKIEKVNIIASGGLNRGMDFAKAIAMGAEIGGSAGQILKAWNNHGALGVENQIEVYRRTLKTAVFITGCKTLENFRKNDNIERCLNI